MKNPRNPCRRHRILTRQSDVPKPAGILATPTITDDDNNSTMTADPDNVVVMAAAMKKSGGNPHDHHQVNDEKQHFCYLLFSDVGTEQLHPRCYIGYSPDPVRRLREHNRDVRRRGARKTSRCPYRWRLVAVIGGFSSKSRALSLEASWQRRRRSHRQALSRTQREWEALYRTLQQTHIVADPSSVWLSVIPRWWHEAQHMVPSHHVRLLSIE